MYSRRIRCIARLIRANALSGEAMSRSISPMGPCSAPDFSRSTSYITSEQNCSAALRETSCLFADDRYRLCRNIIVHDGNRYEGRESYVWSNQRE
jgi:hypothetical protein